MKPNATPPITPQYFDYELNGPEFIKYMMLKLHKVANFNTHPKKTF
tara:strand:+ start:2035 stop:2172 length:138 start_codon:yes stop_codon:yes gene_type:complete